MMRDVPDSVVVHVFSCRLANRRRSYLGDQDRQSFEDQGMTGMNRNDHQQKTFSRSFGLGRDAWLSSGHKFEQTFQGTNVEQSSDSYVPRADL